MKTFNISADTSILLVYRVKVLKRFRQLCFPFLIPTNHGAVKLGSLVKKFI